MKTTIMLRTKKAALHLAKAIATANALLLPLSPAQAQQCTPNGNNQACTNSTNLSGIVGLNDSGNGTLNVTNTPAGTISGSTDGIFANTNANVSNAGSISGTGGVSTGIFVNNTANVTNSGTISASGTNDAGIRANTANVTNSGTISASGNGSAITGNTANVTNSGTISANGVGGEAIAVITANVTNSGTISAGSEGINALTANVINSGSISANGPGNIAIIADTANITNSGTISANGANGQAIAVTTVTITNSGTIAANGPGGTAISVNNSSITNSGTISASGAGGIGIQAFGASTLVNSGTVIGSKAAIDFSQSSNDSLAFLPGTRIIGAILLGSGDAVNVQTGRGLSSMLTFTPNGPFSLTSGGIQPFAISGARFASLDPTAFAMADRAMVDFTQGISSLVNSRFGSMAPVGSSVSGGGAGAMGFAPAASGFGGGFADSANAAFAGIPSLAIAYAPDDAWFKAPAAIPGVGVTTVWTGAFGGVRNQGADGAMLSATDRAVGASIGIDRRVAPNLWVGGFIGGGNGQVSVDLNSQTVKTDYLFGGGYGRYEWGTQFLDVMLYGGHTANSSSRTVTNNLAQGGFETAIAHYDGWFFSPDVAYGRHFDIGGGYVLTPTARLRYVAGLLDGYGETGSAQDLRVGSRTLQDFEQRFELDLAKTWAIGPGYSLKTDLHGGAIGIERVGDTGINTVLLGQNLSFVTPGKSTEFGGLAGGSVDFATVAHINLFGAVEGIWLNDNATILTAKGGIRGAF